MNYEVRNKYISAGATAFCLALLLVFLLLCGFTHKNPPDPPVDEMIVEVQEIELAEDIVLDNDLGGGNGEEGGNFNPENSKPSPGKTDQAETREPVSNPTTANPNSNTAIPEATPTPGFNMGLVGKNGGTSSGDGSGNKQGPNTGLDYGKGFNNGNKSGNGGGWAKIPDFSSLSADKDFYFEFKCTVDKDGKVTNVVKANDVGAPASLVEAVRNKLKNEARYSAGYPGEYKIGVTLKKN